MKRPRMSNDIDVIQHTRKNHANGESSEEPSGDLISKGSVSYKEHSMYDNLLSLLGSGNESFTGICKSSQGAQDGRHDTEEDEVGGFLSTCGSEEEGDHGGSDSKTKSHHLVNPGEHHKEAEIEDNDEEAVDDQVHGLENNDHTDIDASENPSSFNGHLGYTLAEPEIDDLLKRRWKFKWEEPAIDMSMSKWVGTGECPLKEVDSNSTYGLKLKLYKHWLDVYKTSGCSDFHSSRQRLFFSLCNSYRDIMHSNKKPFYIKGLEEDLSIRDAYIMHSLNHVFRATDLVTKNDTKLAKLGEKNKEVLNGEGFLDHGFTRPKVLILLPLRSISLRVIKRLIQLTPSSHRVNVEHFERFSHEFGTGQDEDNNENTEPPYNGHDDENSKNQNSSKPKDFQILFDGNNGDHFMIGIKFTKRSIKLYSDFYSSDLIVASPLGLITKIGEAEVEKDKDVDFLSSIEVLIIDHADVIAMQNWSHVNSVVEHLNKIPSKQHGTDVMRIRPWCLEGHAKFYRQTIMLSFYPNPDMNALFNQNCVNYEGKVKLITKHKGVLPKALLQVRQVYERFDATSIVDADDSRLDYFTKKVLPKIKDCIQGGIMLFVSSYFEFVRIRNMLKSQNASFCLLGEYTKQSDISRSRVWFFEGKRKIMLYTERAHFYHRYKIRGVQNIIIYSLPERKDFYPEIVNMLEGSQNMTCTVLFSRVDHLKLERIVGTSTAKRMTSSKKDVFVFC